MQISNSIAYPQYRICGTTSAARNTGACFGNSMTGAATVSTGDTYDVFLPNENTVYSGGQSNGLSYRIDYAENSTEENPIMIATGVDENGNRFQQELVINNIDPRNATIVEFRALEAYLNGGKMASVGGPTSLLNMGNHGENQQTGLNTRQDFLARMVDKYQFYSNSPYLNHQVIGMGYKEQLDLWEKYFAL